MESTIDRSPSEIVGAEARTRIQVHLETRDRWNTVASLSDLTRKVAHEYEDRFLIELVQNGYDAHQRGSCGGRMHVVLDETAAEHGVLYVANTGRPFHRKNFEALSNVARSNKPPGQGIGNKGLGFRSVLQVCDWPEVYSCSPTDATDPGFGGYCFGFARDEDLRRLAADDAEFAILDGEFSRYLLPVALQPRDEVLQRFRARGAVTVVRLPLKSEQALKVVMLQMDRLVASPAPVLLFLDRLECLEVEHLDGDRLITRHELTRARQPVTIPGAGAQTDCSDVQTAGRRYLLATRSIPEDEVRAVIKSSIDAQQLDLSWHDWDGDAEVSLALPLGQEQSQETFALYTFLPMDVTSPLGGHLNAPFYTKLARVDLSEDVTLNSYFLDVAAALSAELVDVLTREEAAGVEQRPGLVADLVTWDEEHYPRLQGALVDRGLSLQASKLLPSPMGRNASWISLEQAYLWQDDGYEVLTADRLRHVGVHLVDTSIGARRLRRLASLSLALQGSDMTPNDECLADWLEELASDLGRRRASMREWNRFYLDIARCFAGTRRGKALQGRRVLLDQEKKLRRAGPWDDDSRVPRNPTVFFPPRRAADAEDELQDDVAEDDEELRVPKSLQRAVCFLHEGIDLRRREGGTARRTPIIDFLEGAKLVERFDRRALLSHLRRVLRGRVGVGTKREALRWVYLQYRSSRAGLRGLDQMGLHVPTRGGWVPAHQAFFSGGWPDTCGRLIERLISDEGASSPSLEAVGDALLLDPDAWPLPLGDRGQWREFLETIGVRDGLWPVRATGPTIEQDGTNYEPDDVARRFELHEQIAQPWKQHVRETWGGYSALAHPYTPYKGQPELWFLPGQEVFDNFSTAARHIYAALILSTIGYWADGYFEYVFERQQPRHRSKPDRQRWPSPLRTFVERANWFPMADPRRRDETYSVRLGEGWHYDDSDRELAPRFARLCPVDQRRRIESDATHRQALRRYGLRIWNDPSTGKARLVELARLLELGLIGNVETSSFRRACEKAWSDALSSQDGRAVPSPDLPLVTSRGRELRVLYPAVDSDAADRRVLFVEDASVGLVHHILEAVGRDVLVSNPKDGALVAQLLQRRDDLDVKLMSDVRANVVVDGQVVAPGPSTGELLLDAFGRWLPRLVSVAVELQSSPFARVTERVLHDVLARLRRTRLLRATSVAVTVDGKPVDTDSLAGNGLHIEDDEHPVVIIRAGEDEVGWAHLESIAKSLAVLIGQSSAAESLRLAAFALSRVLDDEWREPTDAELAIAFRVSTERVAEITAGLRAEIDYLTFALVPVVASIADMDAARQVEVADPQDRDELVDLLGSIAGPDAVAQLLAAAERAASPDDLRRALDISLEEFNRALRDLGRQPVHFVAAHEDAFRSYVVNERDALLDAIRLRFLPEFVSVGDLSRYSELRSLPGLERDPDWLDSFERPGRDQMQARVMQWLDANEITPGSADSRLAPVDVVRQHNEVLLDRQLPRLRDLVTAWCQLNEAPRPEVWSNTMSVRQVFQRAGCLDFIGLGGPDLLSWADPLNLWPAGMPLSTELITLGLIERDVAKASSQTEAEHERRARERDSIALDGEEHTVGAENLRELVAAARASVTDGFISSTRRVSRLGILPPPGPRGASGGSARGGSRRGRHAPTNEQKEAIGLVGEVLAFEWLRRAYAETTNDSWVSGYRSLGVGGYEGNDSLGYDFEVVQRSQTLHFEVKATAGDEYEFEMGESELRAARAARKDTYRIIFIQEVLDRNRRRLIILPNPLETEHASQFRQVNEGVKFRFNP